MLYPFLVTYISIIFFVSEDEHVFNRIAVCHYTLQ